MREEPPLIQVGKKGLDEGAVKHISRVLEQKKRVRVKFLRSAPERDTVVETAMSLKEQISAERFSRIGFVVTFFK